MTTKALKVWVVTGPVSIAEQSPQLRVFNHVVSQLLGHLENLAWINLSFNDLTSIDPALTTFFKLCVLYLHGNSTQCLGKVNKLAVYHQVQSLTLHRNAREEENGCG